MKVTVEFDEHDEEAVVDQIVGAAARELAARAQSTFDQFARETIEKIREDVIKERVDNLVDAALDDQAIGLPTMIMERVRFEIEEKMPVRTQALVEAAIRALALEEAQRMERERPRSRHRRWGRKG